MIYGHTFDCIFGKASASKVKIFDDALCAFLHLLLHLRLQTKSKNGKWNSILNSVEVCCQIFYEISPDFQVPSNANVSLSEKGLCDVMSGDILELKAMMASTSSLPSPTPSIRTTLHSHEHNHDHERGVTVELQDEKQKNHISVANVLSRPTPSHFRQTSASTFLCPENIPGTGLKSHFLCAYHL